MKSFITGKKLTAAAAALVLGVVSVNIAQASTPPTPAPRTPNAAVLSTIKSRCDAAVKKRVSALQSDITRLNSDSTISASDKSSLLATASSDISGLQALDATIQADTTSDQARADCQKVVTEYRIYALFEPQLHLTAAEARLAAAVTKIQGLSSKLAAVVAKITDPSQLAAAQAALTDLNTKLAAAQASLGQISSVLGLDPSGYPGNKTSLQSVRSSLESVRKDLEGVRADVQTIRNAVGASRPAASPSASPTAA
jgi:hypothetical protein